MIQLPSVKPSKWRLRDAYLDALSGLLALAVGVVAAIKTYAMPGQWGLFVAVCAFSGVAFLVTCVKAIRSVKKERRYEPLKEPENIAGWALGCYRALAQSFPVEESDCRLTVYRVVRDAQQREPVEVEQIVEYVGGSGGPAGRTISARCGAVGLCARSGELVVADRSSDELEQFRSELVRCWGFTQDEARSISVDRWSFVAAPITESDGGAVVAVVFLDSKSKELFADVTVQQSILEHCGVLAEIIRKCYT